MSLGAPGMAGRVVDDTIGATHGVVGHTLASAPAVAPRQQVRQFDVDGNAKKKHCSLALFPITLPVPFSQGWQQNAGSSPGRPLYTYGIKGSARRGT